MSTSPQDERAAQLWDLFSEAVGRDPVGRQELVERVRRERPEMAQELDEMLDASGDHAALAIEAKLQGTADQAEMEGTVAGPYRLLRRIGGGGMGDVYLADRADESFEQSVAVKLMRPGIGSAEMLERFRLERDVLARLTHPAIVPLLDGGTTADGQPYLALQYVEGLPITDFCDEQNLSTAERLRLFMTLCRAVQYAHSKLVVHRDLKPNNVLVTEEGEIRLLDFGIAKLLGARGPGSEITGSIQAPMTPRRAAPEQLVGNENTTATDVWALGVLLHEMVTGRLPEVIGEDRARIDREGISLELARDLGAIVGMALAPEPEERYPSAGHLADDIERHLAAQPVVARPDSRVYRLGRFIRRHRTASVLVGLSVVFLVILAAVSSYQAVRIAEQRNRAEAEERRANATVDLLVELFGTANPVEGARMDTIGVVDLIDRAEDHATRLADQPDVRARLEAVLGKILVERGDRHRGRPLLERAYATQLELLGPDDARTMQTALDLSRALHVAGEMDAARVLVGETLARLESQNQPDPRLLARCLQVYGSLLPSKEGQEILRRAIEIRRGLTDPDPAQQGSALVFLATHHLIRGERDEAHALFSEALELLAPVLGRDHHQVLAIRSNLAFFLPDPADQAREHREILNQRLAQLEGDHVLVANSWIGLGEAQLAAGKPDHAKASFKEGWRIWRQNSPAASQTRRAAFGLVEALEGLGESAEVRRVLDTVADDCRRADRELPFGFAVASIRSHRVLGDNRRADAELAELSARPDLDDGRRAVIAELEAGRPRGE